MFCFFLGDIFFVGVEDLLWDENFGDVRFVGCFVDKYFFILVFFVFFCSWSDEFLFVVCFLIFLIVKILDVVIVLIFFVCFCFKVCF